MTTYEKSITESAQQETLGGLSSQNLGIVKKFLVYINLLYFTVFFFALLIYSQSMYKMIFKIYVQNDFQFQKYEICFYY